MARRGYIGETAPTSLAAGIASGDTSMTAQALATWAGITTNGPFSVTIHRDYPNEEQILVAAINTTTGVMSSVTRGYAGSTAVAHSAGESLEVTSTYLDFDEANKYVNGVGTGTDYYWGPNADASSGTRIHFNTSLTTGVIIAAESSTSNADLAFRQKGAGLVLFQDSGGTSRVKVDPATGDVQSIGPASNFGRGSFGAAQGYTQLGDDNAGNALVVVGHGTATNANIAVRAKGAGQTLLQDGAGNSQVLVGSSTLGFYGHSPIAISTITGAKGGNAALTNLLVALAACGLIIDSTA